MQPPLAESSVLRQSCVSDLRISFDRLRLASPESTFDTGAITNSQETARALPSTSDMSRSRSTKSTIKRPSISRSVCRFYIGGHCKFGTKCRFLHDKQSKVDGPDCSICLETPFKYGLLSNCNHPFCINCIQKWMNKNDRDPELVSSGVIKKCPVCRMDAGYIIPSVTFAKAGVEKDGILAAHIRRASIIPCKYVQEGIRLGKTRPCPFAEKCFYSHNTTKDNHAKSKAKAPTIPLLCGIRL
ncbi:hypothetical protein BASA61_009412 [Batrachochytrium salamandrivorans]|nr:hypothetical protein BASA61_009412 [Batrachochytrium salamandrivorans]KAH9245997.1 hypothetical protein BASA81_016490 [Batrachochytrium salamandrivorans]KAH9274562.1 hypothetical protein BASA83_003198 [Batrachochytrium salamandrivorans]